MINPTKSFGPDSRTQSAPPSSIQQKQIRPVNLFIKTRLSTNSYHNTTALLYRIEISLGVNANEEQMQIFVLFYYTLHTIDCRMGYTSHNATQLTFTRHLVDS